jgi:hypothetical protein
MCNILNHQYVWAVRHLMYVRVNNLENGRYIYCIHCTFEICDSVASENISLSTQREEILPL